MSAHEAVAERAYTIPRIAANLICTCLLSGVILAGTYYVTNPIAVEKNKMLEKQAMQALVPQAVDFEALDDKEAWFAAKNGAGTEIAYVLPARNKGYGGSIRMLVAVALDGRVLDYAILESNETPGLGDGAAKDYFKDRIRGKTADALVVVKDPSDTVHVDALTGATITSRAVTEGVRAAAEEVSAFVGGR
ncbi:MAG: FMN-binding protein [Clostridiales Family XIII bacterium]|jgi:electron transport complex protein RnfG|nr:FMN-binding protein [Clostridiales Family XIII bacterium]